MNDPYFGYVNQQKYFNIQSHEEKTIKHLFILSKLL